MSRPPGSPGSVLPPLKRAAPDRTIWRAPEIKDLPPDIADDDKWGPGAHWRTAPTDPRHDQMFARRATPRPTAHRAPSGYTRRTWRRYEPTALGLSAEELGLHLPAVVDPSAGGVPAAPGRPRSTAHSELAGLALTPRSGEVVGVPVEPAGTDRETVGADVRRDAEVADHEPRVIVPVAATARPATTLADPDLVDLAHPVAVGAAATAARRGTVRTLIGGRDVTDAVAVEQPAEVSLAALTVVAAPHQTLAHARAASSRAVAAFTGPARRAERSIAGGVAMLVLILSFIGYSPLAPANAGTGNVGREASAPVRIAIGAFANGAAPLQDVDGDSAPAAVALPEAEPVDRTAAAISSVDLMPVETAPPNVSSLPTDTVRPLADRYLDDEEATGSTGTVGPFNADGTLVKPVAPTTTVPDSKSQLRTYKVKRGDSATDIAKKFKVTTATVVWSNDLVDEPVLKIGQTLVIPPVNGLVHVVQDGDTLSRLARRFNVDYQRIMEANDLTETTVYLGQTLIIPGGRGEHIGTPPAPAGSDLTPDNPARRNTVTLPSRGSTTLQPRREYSGGGFAWPLPGGSISQYFHYGHYAIDIAGDYGLPVRAAADGVVVFAGWKNNGGGWQVWISHGNGLYTTYNHMSSISVGYGQSVGKGQQVGNCGSSGWATGPHVHFEVWHGPVWDGGQRVNPLNYL